MLNKKMMTAMMCALCMAVTPLSLAAEENAEAEETLAAEIEVVAEEEEETETEADAETEEETDAEAEEAAETEEEAETVAERPSYVALDYVTLGDYKGITVEAAKEEITDEKVEEEYELQISYFGTEIYDVYTEGTVAEGDVVNIDYEGKKDGVAFDGGTAEGYDLEIGSGSFIEGFEDGLIGVKVGETVDLELTFPEGYQAEELAGQDVVFTVTVNEIKRAPEEITDAHIEQATSGEYKDIASFKEYIRNYLEEEAQETYETTILSNAIDLICEAAEISEYPQDLVDYCVNDMVNYYTQYASYYGMEFEDFITAYFGLTAEEFDEQVLAAVQISVKKELTLAAIAETEGIEVSEEEYEASCEEYKTAYGYETVEELVASVGGENVVRVSLLLEKVDEYIRENVVVEEPAEATDEAADEAAETVEEAAEAVDEAADEAAVTVDEAAETVDEEAAEEETEE